MDSSLLELFLGPISSQYQLPPLIEDENEDLLSIISTSSLRTKQSLTGKKKTNLFLKLSKSQTKHADNYSLLLVDLDYVSSILDMWSRSLFSCFCALASCNEDSIERIYQSLFCFYLSLCLTRSH
jgi:hypothetical protein